MSDNILKKVITGLAVLVIGGSLINISLLANKLDNNIGILQTEVRELKQRLNAIDK